MAWRPALPQPGGVPSQAQMGAGGKPGAGPPPGTVFAEADQACLPCGDTTAKCPNCGTVHKESSHLWNENDCVSCPCGKTVFVKGNGRDDWVDKMIEMS